MLSESDGATIDTTEKGRADTIDLTENEISVDISDALSEKESVRFTIHSKIKLQGMPASEFNVVRLHEEFRWLHGQLLTNGEYAGLIIPPPPPHPDFRTSREKLEKLSQNENTMTKEEYEKMKSELEAEYLALFKKTVSMHEVFLQRIAAHLNMKLDENFLTFLKYKDDLSVRGKNAKEQIGGFFQNLTKSADQVFLANQKETDEFFEGQKRFLTTYHAKIREAVTATEKATRSCRHIPDAYIKTSSCLTSLVAAYPSKLEKYFQLLADFFERSRKIESRIQSDIDLKLCDTLRYYAEDSKAGLDLLYRRARASADLDTANKTLDRARIKNKEVQPAEENQQRSKERFDKISEKSKEELKDFKRRRVQMFKKNLVELTELQIKHTKTQLEAIKAALQQAESI